MLVLSCSEGFPFFEDSTPYHKEENPVNEKSKMSRILLSVVATENEICQNVTKRIKQHVPGMINYIIRVMKNPVFGISDQVQYKWCCTDIEDN